VRTCPLTQIPYAIGTSPLPLSQTPFGKALSTKLRLGYYNSMIFAELNISAFHYIEITMPIKIIRKFPDIRDPKFSFKEWDKQFYTHNTIINDSYRSIYFPEHWTTLSLKCAFGGTEYYIIDRMKYAVNDSSYLVVNQDTVYESLIDSESPVESFTMNFTSDFADDVYYSISSKDQTLLDFPELRDKVPVSFIEKLFPYNPGFLAYLENLRNLIRFHHEDHSMLNETFHFILEFLFYQQIETLKQIRLIDEKKYSTRIELFKRLNQAKDYMYSNYRHNIELNELGRVSCLSPHYLLRKFKKHFGITPHQFLTSRRMEAAKEMLLKTNKSITEICEAAGFESLSSFGVLFKKFFKFSPENYKIYLKS
jgi:AraC-like DNA-binding protein